MNIIKLKENFYEGKISKHQYIEEMYQKFHKNLFEYRNFIKKTNISKIEIEDDNVIMTIRNKNIKFVCNVLDPRNVVTEILNFEDYEKELLEKMIFIISKLEIKNIYDIGANIGWYYINLGERFKTKKIYSFEPVEKTYNFLGKNVKLNQLKNVEINNFGLSLNNSKEIFYVPENEFVNASMKNLKNFTNVEEIVCHLKKMDDWNKENNIYPDFIKCDVEGAELLVLKGGEETLKSKKPVIFIELLRKWAQKFNYHPNEVIKFLKNLGYKCFIISNNNLIEVLEITETTQETNFIFLHEEKHKVIINF